MVGGTNDISLSQISSNNYVPYVVLQSIEIAEKIYWAKAFPLKIGEYFGGV